MFQILTDDQACAISHATGPSPIIASELGTLLAPVASLFVHGQPRKTLQLTGYQIGKMLDNPNL